MFPDFKDLIALLNGNRVEYLVVGGYAVSRHAQPRATGDLDILVRPAPKNAAALFRALQEFGAPLRTRAKPDADPRSPTRKLTAKDFEDRGSWYTMGVPPIAIDILLEIPGVTFDAAWKNRSAQTIDEETGLKAYFISRADLIAAKLAAGRTRDLADVEELRKAEAASTTATPAPPISAKRRARAKGKPPAKP